MTYPTEKPRRRSTDFPNLRNRYLASVFTAEASVRAEQLRVEANRRDVDGTYVLTATDRASLISRADLIDALCVEIGSEVGV